METKPSSPWDVLAPRPLLLGVALSFVVCCVAGRLFSRMNCYEDFARFHPYISLQSQFYPTASQVRTLARARLDRDKIAVIVGGNSVLYGAGQRVENRWTELLQRELGDGYRVINLGVCGAFPLEFGGVIADHLAREYPKLIFITNASTNACQQWPRDGDIYRYFFWDACYKGLIPPDRGTVPALRPLDAGRERGEKFAELRRCYRLDAALYFQDLWTRVAYQHVATVWCPCVGGSMTRPRKRYRDPDPGPLPLDQRYPPDQEEARPAWIRAMIRTTPFLLAHLRGEEGKPGAPVPPPGWLAQSLDRFPPHLRPRTLMLLPRESPHYLARLTPRERAEYDELNAATVALMAKKGVMALDLGRDYTPADCISHGHFSEEGGRKMALDTARGVRELARRLGYTTGAAGDGRPAAGAD